MNYIKMNMCILLKKKRRGKNESDFSTTLMRVFMSEKQYTT